MKMKTFGLAAVLCGIFSIWSSVVGGAGAAEGEGAKPQGKTLRAGAAAVEITPTKFPVNMPGGFGPNLAEGAHDPLFARAVVFDDGEAPLALVVVDNLGVARETLDEAKALAAKRCPVRPERIFASSTHTHSAPPSNAVEGAAEAVAYRKQLVEGIAEAVVQAHQKLRPAAVGAASHPLPEELFNRRWFLRPGKMPPNPFGGRDLVRMNPGLAAETLLHPAGGTDPDVSVLAVQDLASKKPLAVYANYGLHYVGGLPPKAVSADYFGEFARLLPSRFGPKAEFTALLSNGASGDVNNIPTGLAGGRPPREPFEQVRIVAGKTADAAWRAHGKIASFDAAPRLGMVQRELSLRVRRPSPEQVAEAKRVMDLVDEAEVAKLPPLAKAYAPRVLALEKSGETLSAQLQVVRVGDAVLVGIPFETFAETGLDLKRRSPFPQTIVVGLANGYHGYLPTPEQHRLGGYETWLGTNRVQEDASVLITDALLEMLAELAKKEQP